MFLALTMLLNGSVLYSLFCIFLMNALLLGDANACTKENSRICMHNHQRLFGEDMDGRS